MLISAFALTLASVQTGGGAQPERTAGIALSQAAVSSELKDPDSAKFNWPYDFRYGTFRLMHSIDGWITCGTVNAKNSFGGYVGAEPVLIVIRDGAVAAALVEEPGSNILAKQCRQLGMPVGW